MLSFKEYFALYEEFKDISKEDKLYHQTNAVNLFKILDSGFLMPRQFRFGSSNLHKTYQEKTSPNELATGRKSTYTNLDTAKNSKEKMESLSYNVGYVRFELYKERLKAGKYVRGLKIKPIAEFAISERNEIKKILEKYNVPNSTKEVEALIKIGTTLKFDNRTYNKLNVVKLVNAKDYLKKLNEKDFKDLYDAIETSIHYSANKENEERLVFSGKNEKKYKDDFLNSPNDKLFLNAELMKINLIPGFIKEFLNSVAPASFLKYYNKVKRWKELFNETPEYKEFLNIMNKFSNNTLTIEYLISKGLDKEAVAKYQKVYNKDYLPSQEQRKEEAKQYTKTGGKRVGRVYTKKYSEEDLKKQIEDTKKKIMSKIK